MTTSKELNELGLISGNRVSDIFDEFYSDILTRNFDSPSAFVKDLWPKYWLNYDNKSPSLNGAVFEGILATLLFRSEILPLYVQAKLAFVPNVEFDFIAYTEEYGPIILSAKTSLRERYKQADLEGMMLRQVHRKAKSYLITLNSREADTLNKKIKNEEVLGLDGVIVASDKKFDELINELKTYEYVQPEKMDVLTSSRLITNKT